MNTIEVCRLIATKLSESDPQRKLINFLGRGPEVDGGHWTVITLTLHKKIGPIVICLDCVE